MEIHISKNPLSAGAGIKKPHVITVVLVQRVFAGYYPAVMLFD